MNKLLVPDKWSDPNLPRVYKTYTQTDDIIKRTLWNMRKDFGPKGERWWWTTSSTIDHDNRSLKFEVLFIFKDVHDATLFGIKY